MFLLVGTQGSTQIIRVENEKTLCKHCNNMVNKKIVYRYDKATLFTIPLISYSKHYFRRCIACGIDQEITENEAYNGMKSEESEGYTGIKDQTPYLNIPGFQDNSGSLR